jgi:hypothetical protein
LTKIGSDKISAHLCLFPSFQEACSAGCFKKRIGAQHHKVGGNMLTAEKSFPFCLLSKDIAVCISEK